MINHLQVALALRTRLLTLSAATTGAINAAATATGYTRAAGSFLTDGFCPGMELLAAGHTAAADNGTGLVTAVTAGALAVDAYTVAVASTLAGYTVTPRTLVAEGAAAGRTYSVGLPALRAWENVSFEPVAGKPWVEEDYLPGPAAQFTTGPHGRIEATPQYVVKLYGPPGKGVSALYLYADAVLLLFAPRTALTLAGGDVVRVRTDPAPYRGQLVQDAAGFAVVVVTIPLRVETANSI